MNHIFAQTSLENAVRYLKSARDQITEYIADNDEDHKLRYQAIVRITKAIGEAEEAAKFIAHYADEEAELASRALGVEV